MKEDSKKYFKKSVLRLFLLFVVLLIVILCCPMPSGIVWHKPFLIGANVVMVLLSVFVLKLHTTDVSGTNPRAVGNKSVAKIMLGSLIKLLVIIGGILIYLLIKGSHYAVFDVAATMLFFILYSCLEVMFSSKLNRIK